MPALRTRDTQSRSLEVTTAPAQTLSPPSLAIISPTPRAFTFPANTHSSLQSLTSLDPLNESPFSSPYPSPFSSPLGTPSQSPSGSRAGSPFMLQEPFQFDTHFGRNGFVDGDEGMGMEGMNGMSGVEGMLGMERTISPTCLSPSLVPTIPTLPSLPHHPSSQMLPLPSQPLPTTHTGSSTSSLTHKRRKSSHSHSHSLTRSPTSTSARSRSLSKPSLHIPPNSVSLPSPLRDTDLEEEDVGERSGKDAGRSGNGGEKGGEKERGGEKEKERRPKKGDEDYIKRPENAFILFRRKCCEERNACTSSTSSSTPSSPSVSRSQSLSSTSRSPLPPSDSPARSSSSTSSPTPVKKQRQADLSKTISQQWKALAPEERMYWEELAKEKKREHERMYPGYVYRPQRGGKRNASKASSGSTAPLNGKDSKDKKEDGGKGRKNSMVSIASTDADLDEDDERAEDSSSQDDKKEQTLSFVVPTLPSHSHLATQHSGATHLSPFDAIATQLTQTQQGQQGGQMYNRPAYHGRSASAPTPPPFNTLSPLLQQHQQQYQSFPQDASQYSGVYSNASSPYAQQGYYPQQGYGQQWFGYSGGVAGGMGQQRIQIPNVYSAPNANSCPTSPSPNMDNVGGMNMLPTSPTTDVPMISGARRGSAPGHSASTHTGEAFESSDFLRGMYNMSSSLPHSLSRKPLSLSTSSLSTSTSTSTSALSASPASSSPPSPNSLSSAFERSSLHDGSNTCGDISMGVDYSMGAGFGGGAEYNNGIVGGGIGEEYAGFQGFGADVYGYHGFNGAVHGWSSTGGNGNGSSAGDDDGANAHAHASGKSLSTTPTPQMFSPAACTYSPASTEHAPNADPYAAYASYPEFSGIGVGVGVGEMDMNVHMGAMGGGMGAMGAMGMFMPDDFDIAAIQSVEFGLPPAASPDLRTSGDALSSSSSGKLHVEAYEHRRVGEHAEYNVDGGNVGMGGMGGGVSMGGMGMDTDMHGAVNV